MLSKLNGLICKYHHLVTPLCSELTAEYLVDISMLALSFSCTVHITSHCIPVSLPSKVHISLTIMN
jgi:hypothetical protein